MNMKYLVLFLLTFSAINAEAAVWTPSIDTLPKWEVFKKMTKSQLLEMAKGDSAATEIVKGKNRKQMFVGATISGVSAILLGVAAAYVGSLQSVEMESSIYLLATIVLGFAAFTLAIVAIFLIISAFTRSRKKQYRQWNELLKSRAGKE